MHWIALQYMSCIALWCIALGYITLMVRLLNYNWNELQSQ